MKKEKVLVIVGPTAVGKTALSIDIAKRYGGEVISGDSMQIYRHLNIGTAKVTLEEMDGVPHHLIDILEPDESYSASEFQAMAKEKIRSISQNNALPIVVGGTGLYIEGLLYNMQFGGNKSIDTSIAEKLEKELKQKGANVLYERLVRVDAKAAEKIPIQNERRLLRALTVIESTGMLFSQQEDKTLVYDSLVIGLTTERDRLYERIDLRVDNMINQGLLEEAKWLYEHYEGDFQSKKAIGYKELFPYLSGEDTLEHAVDVLKQQSRRYAKRQLTWFRNRMDVLWFDLWQVDKEDIYKEIDEWLKR
ncbi:tRNA (adenosine(37)-N6)-dimethylallyltransferase MiaA [Carnobacteriaceae bacterium zg-84]|uniref:tRNA (adenosine(37)-N6)-dimethylallyltransferase MiaA n=1 Tax=Granulicatella sp. zg-84 TaxID=2678503 RepID=UPI0013C2257E|nr:tRNA (adenosine(37)-N6)-dimethylallyltransferase MiaA [Granulicatella sp. zg-84]NEW66209.1 tRNA (adenosine(37)-N6)-dimethylallyltransferase MiaA [Granulicatella sp. zg-84]QMI85948.1 tRNA (adenosine(37)-N6)-dimethylallyltransferase MiaA [Carnobacteriaceae bacterium zg-84]